MGKALNGKELGRGIENGMPPKSLQKILGHDSLQLTMDLYCHVTEDTLFEAMKLMEKCVPSV